MEQYWDWLHVACSFHKNREKVFHLRAKKKELLHKGVSKRHNIKEKREQ